MLPPSTHALALAAAAAAATAVAAPQGLSPGCAATEEAPAAGNGTYGFAGDGGSATAGAMMRFPEGVALSPSGELLYVADSGNGRVRVVDLSTAAGTIGTYAGGGTLRPGSEEAEACEPEAHSYGSWGCDSGCDVPAGEAMIDGPQDVAAEPSGDLLIVEANTDFLFRVTRSGEQAVICAIPPFPAFAEAVPPLAYRRVAAAGDGSTVAVMSDSGVYLLDERAGEARAVAGLGGETPGCPLDDEDGVSVATVDVEAWPGHPGLFFLAVSASHEVDPGERYSTERFDRIYLLRLALPGGEGGNGGGDVEADCQLIAGDPSPEGFPAPPAGAFSEPLWVPHGDGGPGSSARLHALSRLAAAPGGGVLYASEHRHQRARFAELDFSAVRAIDLTSPEYRISTAVRAL